jgi:uncharacterized damage-inducible protein DinB
MAGEDRGSFGRALLRETERRLFDEQIPRLYRSLSLLEDEEIWRRPNENTPSVGNLVLHLCGNVRQWIGTGIGGAPDVRKRAEEFSEEGPLPKEDLTRRIDEMQADARKALAAADPASLLETHRIQAFEETGLAILVHVVEHFSYHVGQISYVAKSIRNVDLAYYEGMNLDETT